MMMYGARNVTGVVLTAFAVIVSPAVSTDGRRVSWKDNFESHYTEVAELGRYQTTRLSHFL